VSERETDIGRSQADLAGQAQEPDEIDVWLLKWYLTELPGIEKELRALVSAREKRVREECALATCSKCGGSGGGPDPALACSDCAGGGVQRPQPSLSPEIEDLIRDLHLEEPKHRPLTWQGMLAKWGPRIEAIVRDAVAGWPRRSGTEKADE
jgi:hypothetical protein